MGLLEELSRRNAGVAAPKRCKCGELLDSLDPDTQAALIIFIENARSDKLLPQSERLFTARWLEKTLSDNGYKVGKTVLSEHISERCACDTGK